MPPSARRSCVRWAGGRFAALFAEMDLDPRHSLSRNTATSAPPASSACLKRFVRRDVRERALNRPGASGDPLVPLSLCPHAGPQGRRAYPCPAKPRAWSGRDADCCWPEVASTPRRRPSCSRARSVPSGRWGQLRRCPVGSFAAGPAHADARRRHDRSRALLMEVASADAPWLRLMGAQLTYDRRYENAAIVVLLCLASCLGRCPAAAVCVEQ